MKILGYLYSVSLVCLLASCEQSLFDNLDKAEITVTTNDNTGYDGNVITVKKGTPVEFNLNRVPEIITFYSGETGHEYMYKDRVQGNPEDALSAKLKFKIWTQWGISRTGGLNSCQNLMDVLFVTENEDGTPVFPGLSRVFEEDSVLLEKNIPWQNLVERTELPQSVINSSYEAKYIEKDLTPYIGKKFTMALVLNRDKREAPILDDGSTIALSTFYFVDMHIETAWKNGTVSKMYANAFGFTPVNMKNKTVFDDHSDNENDMPKDLEYGAVTTGVEGLWNTSGINLGNFSIYGANAGKKWKYSWMVSDYLNFYSTGGPDRGVMIKDTSLDLPVYSYTYNEVGTYRATFAMVNENYADSHNRVIEFLVNVVE